MKLGVLMPNWVGDVAMATPTLRALRQEFAAAEILAIGRPHLKAILDGTTWTDRWLAWEHRGWGSAGRTLHLVRQLRGVRLDAMLLLRNSLRGALAARLGGARETIGYARRGSALLLSRPLATPRDGDKLRAVSAVDYFLALAEALGCRPASRRLELATLPADEDAADAFWRRMALPDPSQVVLLNAGGAYGEAKRWPAEHCSELARKIAGQLDLAVLVLCGPAERAEAARIVAAAGHPLVRSCAEEDVGFGITKAIIRRSRLLISTDSGPRHLAAGLGTPTITLFGPIDPRWSENYQPDAIQLRQQLECSPCGRRVCPLGHHRCMRELTVDRVLQSVVGVLNGGDHLASAQTARLGRSLALPIP